MTKVQTGLDIPAAQASAPLRGMKVGLVVHPASCGASLRHAIGLFPAAPHFTFSAVFGPEHGLMGQAQDLIHVAEHESTGTGPPPVSTVCMERTPAACVPR
jgi:uncharacterized protein YbbC (DUF1343 family)